MSCPGCTSLSERIVELQEERRDNSNELALLNKRVTDLIEKLSQVHRLLDSTTAELAKATECVDVLENEVEYWNKLWKSAALAALPNGSVNSDCNKSPQQSDVGTTTQSDYQQGFSAALAIATEIAADVAYCRERVYREGAQQVHGELLQVEAPTESTKSDCAKPECDREFLCTNHEHEAYEPFDLDPVPESQSGSLPDTGRGDAGTLAKHPAQPTRSDNCAYCVTYTGVGYCLSCAGLSAEEAAGKYAESVHGFRPHKHTEAAFLAGVAFRTQPDSLAEMELSRDRWMRNWEDAVKSLKKQVDEMDRYVAALRKLRDGPGRDMAAWKLTWAHEFASRALGDVTRQGDKP